MDDASESAVMPAGGGVPRAGGLDVLIVSYRCERLLRDCLATLAEHPPARPMRVEVIDNASGDGTAEMVEREFPQVRLTRLARNRGFSVANNVALRTSQAAYALILNPDTKVSAGAIEATCRVLDEHPEVGIVGPRLEREDGSFDHAAKRSFPTPLGALAHFSGLGRRSWAPPSLSQYRATQRGELDAGPVDAVNGAFMLIRRAALEQVGLFDEGYWMYMEDLDLCYRFAEAGWTTWYEPSATVLHVKAGTSGQHRSFRLNYAFHYGMYRFYRTHYASERGPFLNAAVYGAIALKLAVSAARSAAARAIARTRDRPTEQSTRGTTLASR